MYDLFHNMTPGTLSFIIDCLFILLLNGYFTLIYRKQIKKNIYYLLSCGDVVDLCDLRALLKPGNVAMPNETKKVYGKIWDRHGVDHWIDMEDYTKIKKILRAKT